MGDVQLPENFGTWANEIERRLRAVETAPKLQNSSITNGTTTVLDSTGAVRTQFGLLQDGTYGIGVINNSGQLVSLGAYVFGAQYDYVDPTFNTSSTTPVDASPPGPTVTITTGQTGRVLINASAYIGLNVTSQTGSVFLFANGSQVAQILAVSNANSAIAANISSARIFTFAANSSVTLSLRYAASTNNVNFSGRVLYAQPL